MLDGFAFTTARLRCLNNGLFSSLCPVSSGAVGCFDPTLASAISDNHLIRVETSDQAALLDLLLRRRVDAIVLVDDVFTNLVAERQLEPNLFARSVQLSDAPLVIKLQRRYADQLPALNAALQGMLERGEVERIRSSHLSKRSQRASE